MIVRPMTAADVATAEEISADAFHALDLRLHRAGEPDPVRRTPAHGTRWIERTAAFLDTDAGGCWVAEEDGEVVGFATSFRREQVWCLATFAVRPGRQGGGIGARLLAAAEQHAEGAAHGMLAASDDPRAVRRYHAAGFRLHPQLRLTGEVDRRALGPVTGIREGGPADLDWMDDLDRRHRGGPHGADHLRLLAAGRLLVTAERTGYAYTNANTLALLAAHDVADARRLLAACLAGTEGGYEIAHVTEANRWAVETGLDAGLALSTRGYLGLRGMAPPAPYVHHGALL